MRLIDADELLKKMDIAIAMMERTMIALDIEDYAEAQMELKAYKDIRNGINDEPTVHPESNWISCKERLPDESNFYMVTNEYDEVEIIWFAHKDDYDIDKSEWRETKDKIVAWQPLPKRYREEGGEE